MAITLEMIMAVVTALGSRIYSVVQVKKHVKNLDKKVTKQGVIIKNIKDNCLPTIERKVDETKKEVIVLQQEDRYIKKRIKKLEGKKD